MDDPVVGQWVHGLKPLMMVGTVASWALLLLGLVQTHRGELVFQSAAGRLEQGERSSHAYLRLQDQLRQVGFPAHPEKLVG